MHKLQWSSGRCQGDKDGVMITVVLKHYFLLKVCAHYQVLGHCKSFAKNLNMQSQGSSATHFDIFMIIRIYWEQLSPALLRSGAVTQHFLSIWILY